MSHARRRPPSSIRQANVRIVATRWPVCQTPPRVVTHQIWVENPSRTSARPGRAAADADATEQPPAHSHAPGGEERVDPGLDLVGVSGPRNATSGISTIAGNGANGT